jgi:hypothetical protein
MSLRLVTLVQEADIHPPIRQFLGIPPELDPERGWEPMAWPRVLVIHESYGQIFVDRLTANGTFAGNTWHKSVEHAKEEAEEEYPMLLGRWVAVPPEIGNEELVAFAESHVPIS